MLGKGSVLFARVVRKGSAELWSIWYVTVEKCRAISEQYVEVCGRVDSEQYVLAGQSVVSVVAG